MNEQPYKTQATHLFIALQQIKNKGWEKTSDEQLGLAFENEEFQQTVILALEKTLAIYWKK